jgi:7,8-dihydropterin-6-yl-methyl-4-(beta-D-ribofuranosyl)aminobenzene 5'-phosphate synthase
VGIPFKRSYLESLGANFILNNDFTEVGEGMFLTGEVPRKTSFEKLDPKLFTEVDGKTAPDVFPDDQSLILNTDRGLLVLLGCAHSGIINILSHVISKTGKDRFCAIVGGTHLDFLAPEQLEETMKALRRMRIERIGASHCTGMRGAFRLQQEFGDRYFYGHVGSTLSL